MPRRKQTHTPTRTRVQLDLSEDDVVLLKETTRLFDTKTRSGIVRRALKLLHLVGLRNKEGFKLCLIRGEKNHEERRDIELIM